MNILAVDTTSSSLIIALIDGEGVHTVSREVGKSGHSSILTPEIKSLMESRGLAPTDLDVVAAVVGPGSFTGIRIGAATVTALSFATGAKRIAITSFELIAYNRGDALTAVDAGHGNLYLAKCKDGKVLSTEFVAADESGKAINATFDTATDRATTLACVALKKATEGDFVSVIEPFYMRKSQAEREKDDL